MQYTFTNGILVDLTGSIADETYKMLMMYKDLGQNILHFSIADLIALDKPDGAKFTITESTPNHYEIFNSKNELVSKAKLNTSGLTFHEKIPLYNDNCAWVGENNKEYQMHFNMLFHLAFYEYEVKSFMKKYPWYDYFITEDSRIIYKDQYTTQQKRQYTHALLKLNNIRYIPDPQNFNFAHP